MVWDKLRIKTHLKRLHKVGANLSYNALARKNQSLVSAAAYHYGSYRAAVEAAGIDYAEVTRRPRWTKQTIIRLIKQAKRSSEESCTGRLSPKQKGRARPRVLFACLQPRLFGPLWDRSVHAAGLDADDVSRYRKWDRNMVAFELRARAQDDEPLNSGAIQQDDSGLHAAAVRHFGSYDSALRAARIDPHSVRRRRAWTKAQVIAALKAERRAGKKLSDSAIRRENPALYGAAVRLFGQLSLQHPRRGQDSFAAEMVIAALS